jgi:hypothetical protein
MSHFTAFAGLTELDPGDPITVNGSALTNEDPGVVDHYLRIGAISHRHDAHAPLPDPVGTPDVVVQASGQITAQTQIYVAYTLVDTDGGETRRSTATLVTTGVQPGEPTDSPTAIFASGAGSLPVGQYAYALTLNDSSGGESTIGPAVFVQRQPGFASGQVVLAGLAAEVDGTTWVSWNLWRAQDGGDFQIIATGQSDTFTDTGLICTDASRTPPIDMSNVGSTFSLSITLPTAAQDASINGVAGGGSAVSLNLYLSPDGTFTNPCLYASYPVASGGQAVSVTQLVLSNGAPPPVSRSLTGADPIDPDTEMLDFPWKRPVAASGDLPTTGNADGDMRIALANHLLYIWVASGSAWVAGGGVSGTQGPAGPQGPPATATVGVNQVSASGYTLAISDAGGVVEMSASGAVLTIPTNTAVNFALDTVIEVCQTGPGQLTVQGATGVTIDSPPGAASPLKAAGQWATLGLRQRAINEWIVSGRTA